MSHLFRILRPFDEPPRYPYQCHVITTTSSGAGQRGVAPAAASPRAELSQPTPSLPSTVGGNGGGASCHAGGGRGGECLRSGVGGGSNGGGGDSHGLQHQSEESTEDERRTRTRSEQPVKKNYPASQAWVTHVNSLNNSSDASNAKEFPVLSLDTNLDVVNNIDHFLNTPLPYCTICNATEATIGTLCAHCSARSLMSNLIADNTSEVEDLLK